MFLPIRARAHEVCTYVQSYLISRCRRHLADWLYSITCYGLFSMLSSFTGPQGKCKSAITIMYAATTSGSSLVVPRLSADLKNGPIVRIWSPRPREYESNLDLAWLWYQPGQWLRSRLRQPKNHVLTHITLNHSST